MTAPPSNRDQSRAHEGAKYRERCVSYFTLRVIVILMETIKDLYNSAAQHCLAARVNCAPRKAPENTESAAFPCNLSGILIRPVHRELRRVHWSKEASNLAFAFPYWSIPIKFNWKHWIIDTMMETIIRRWCCHVGGNNFISR